MAVAQSQLADAAGTTTVATGNFCARTTDEDAAESAAAAYSPFVQKIMFVFFWQSTSV